MTSRSDRYYYFRAYHHPFGWGVCDIKTSAVVAMGDKQTCAFLASVYNGDQGLNTYKPSDFTDFAKNWDTYYGAHNSASAYEYDYDTGNLTPFKVADRLRK